MTYQEAKAAGFIDALDRGETLEFKNPCSEWETIPQDSYLGYLRHWNKERIRIKPKPQTRPWQSPDDLPNVDLNHLWFMSTEYPESRFMLQGFTKNRLHFGQSCFNWDDLQKYKYLWNTNPKAPINEWKKCEVEVKQ